MSDRHSLDIDTLYSVEQAALEFSMILNTVKRMSDSVKDGECSIDRNSVARMLDTIFTMIDFHSSAVDNCVEECFRSIRESRSEGVHEWRVDSEGAIHPEYGG